MGQIKRDPLLTLKGKLLLLLTVVLQRILRFLPTIPLPGRGIPPMIGECVEQEN